jgi:hypothetical protein
MISNVAILIFIVLLLSLLFVMQKTESFANTKMMNPQGSYKSNNTFNPGPAVENTHAPIFSSDNNNNGIDPGKIELIKSDGVALGTYSPWIVRPFDNVSSNPSKGSGCNWPAYSDKKHQQWCSEENAIKYHAMRPIITAEKYNELLEVMFKGMKDSNIPIPGDDNFEEVNMAVFCTETQKSLMSWLMQKIAVQVEKIPDFQKNSSWGSERFYELDVQMYQYVLEPKQQTYFKILFNLYNPLRSVSTYVVATIFLQDGKPKLVDIDFVNEGKMNDYVGPQNGLGPINAQNVDNGFKNKGAISLFVPLGVEDSPDGLKKWEDDYKKNPNSLNWNYQNTLQEQKFNDKGFHSNVKEDNIEIKGGIPESLRNKLKACANDQLLACVVPRFTGMQNGQPTNVGGEVKNVRNNPITTYKNDALSLRQVETVDGLIYV